MNKDVFISYKAEEFHIADNLRAAIEAAGIHCWMAPADIPGGSSYAAEIPAAIRNCKIYVLVLSSLAQESKWIPRELDQAINDNKIIMPFAIENCLLKDEFKFYLTNVQRYMAYEDYDAAFAKLIRDIKRHLGIVDPVVANTVVDEVNDKVVSNEVSTVKNEKIRPENRIYDTRTTQPKFKLKSNAQATKWLALLAGVIAGFVGVVILFINLTTVVIEGERYGVARSSLYLENATLDSKELAAIAKMKQLSTISLENCIIEDENLGQIIGEEVSNLYLRNCNLTKTQLQSIDLAETTLYSLDLSGNTELDSLEIIEPACKDIMHLDVSYTSVVDISGLASCENLMTFAADGNGISDITVLQNCTELQQVFLNGNKLTSLNGLENCIELREIQAAANEITSIEGLANATVLQKVYLDYNDIADVTILSKSANTIKYLYLRDNNLSDIAFLENFVNLTYVALDDNQLQSLEVLENIKGLVGVSASGNKLQNTKGLEGKDALKYVNLANNEITEVGIVSPLSLANAYEVILDLSNNPVINANITCDGRIKMLSLSNCEIQDYAFLYSLKVNELVFDYSELIDYSRLAQTDVYEYIIINCPLDQQLSVKDTLGTYSVQFVDSASECYKIADYLDLNLLGTKEYYHE